jgi:periplasmic protein TonB
MNTSASLPGTPTPDPLRPGEVGSDGWLGTQSIFGTYDAKRGQRAAGATAVSVGIHVALFLIIGFLTYQAATNEEPRPSPSATLVYLEQPGPGGGGGGSPAPAPPKPVSIPKTTPLPPPPVAPTPIPVVEPPPPPKFAAPVMTPDATLAQATGAASVSLAEYGGGGRGTGLGPGAGSGVGPGTGGGFGGGAMQPGAGIKYPELVREVKPAYTSEAMRAKLQGSVQLEAVVLANGTVGDVRVVKSLDRVMGLDQEAIKAGRMWIFRPATDREGKPVAVIITMILDFRLF